MSTIAHSSSVATPATLSISAPTKRNHRTPPPIPPDKEPQLYNAFFDGQSSLVDIAREFNLSVTHLVAWTAQQHVQNKLLDVAELGRTRARLLASEGSGRAVHTLDTISTFHQSDTGDAKTTNAHAKRHDVSRKSATDMLKIGLHSLDGLFNYTGSDSDNEDPIDHEPPSHKPRDRKLTNLPQRPRSAAAYLRACAGGAAGSVVAASEAAEATNRPRDSITPTQQKPTPVPRVAGTQPRSSENTSDPTPPAPPETNQAPQPGPDRAVTPESQATARSTEAPAPQPEGLTAHSRGVERGPASDTPGRHAQIQPHSEGVHAPQSTPDSTSPIPGRPP